MNEFNLIKFCVCYKFEKLHRHVYDNYFFTYEDTRYKELTFADKLILRIYAILFRVVYVDFREYLRHWTTIMKPKYLRYNKYWRL